MTASRLSARTAALMAMCEMRLTVDSSSPARPACSRLAVCNSTSDTGPPPSPEATLPPVAASVCMVMASSFSASPTRPRAATDSVRSSVTARPRQAFSSARRCRSSSMPRRSMPTSVSSRFCSSMRSCVRSFSASTFTMSCVRRSIFSRALRCVRCRLLPSESTSAWRLKASMPLSSTSRAFSGLCERLVSVMTSPPWTKFRLGTNSASMTGATFR
jgi:hypothetical protein